MTSVDTDAEARHPVNEMLPPGKLAIYGFQHVLAFFAGGAIVIPIIIASSLGLSGTDLVHLINAALLTCGIASIIQSVGFWKIGVRLPLLQGIAFVSVSPMIAIGLGSGGGTQGLRTVYGAVIACGLITFAIAPVFSKLVHYFPPVVTGSVITIIGLALLPVAAISAVGGDAAMDPGSSKNMAYALGTLAVIILVQKISSGFVATVGVLLSLILGTLVAWAFGDASFAAVGTADWFGLSQPFQFGTPQFSATAIISMMVAVLITSIETAGAVFAVSEVVNRRARGDDLARAMRADGLSLTIGGAMNSFPYTCFSENVGLVRLTGVKSRWVIAAAGVFMILLGLVPKFAAVVTTIPAPVLGGASLAMFAMVAVVGFQILSRVDFHDHRNSMIVAASIGLGMYVTAVPDVKDAVPGWAEILVGSGITIGALTAIVLNIVFHHVAPSLPGRRAGASKGTTLGQVNAMTSTAFAQDFGALYGLEDAASDRVHAQAPFSTRSDLQTALNAEFFGQTEEDSEACLRSYPGLTSTWSAPNATERPHAKLTGLSDSEAQDLDSIAQQYEGKFGFPLIVDLDVVDAEDVPEYVRQRLANSAHQERNTAQVEIVRIAGRQLKQKLIAE